MVNRARQRFAALLLLGAGAFVLPYGQGWGRVTWSTSDLGALLFDNGVIEIHYGKVCFSGADNCNCVLSYFGFDEFAPDRNVAAGSQMDGHWWGDAGRSLSSAYMVHDGADSKRLHTEWNGGDVVQEFAIYPGLPLLEVDHLRYATNVCDFTMGSNYEIYGAEAWQALRMTVPENDGGGNEHEALTHDLYPEYPNPLTEPSWGLSLAPLSYRGWAILAVCKINPRDPTAVGWGFAKVLPVDAANCVKLLHPGGFEQFLYFQHYYFGTANHRFTAYYVVVRGGADEIAAFAKKVVDWAEGGSIPEYVPTRALAPMPGHKGGGEIGGAATLDRRWAGRRDVRVFSLRGELLSDRGGMSPGVRLIAVPGGHGSCMRRVVVP
jgi:hypothetical protein